MIAKLKLPARHAYKVLIAMVATAGVQFGALLGLQKPIETLFGIHASQAFVTICNQGAATCTALLTLQGVILAFSHSITEAEDSP